MGTRYVNIYDNILIITVQSTSAQPFFDFQDANYNLGGVLDPLKRDLRRCAREAIFAHFASLVDNTIYGGNPKKIKDGHISGVKNTIISRSEFAKQRNLEIDRVNNMENVISTFFAFRNMMMEEPVKRSPI